MNVKERICDFFNTLFFKIDVFEKSIFLKEKDYKRWQYNSIKTLFSEFKPEPVLHSKRVLDLCCGEGGKTQYFVEKLPELIVGLDFDREKLNAAKKLSSNKKVYFQIGDARHLPFKHNTFDLILINDGMEHVLGPEIVIQECKRVLTNKGRIYIDFPPYYHPKGAHLDRTIRIPWCHIFFSEKTLVKVAVKQALRLGMELEIKRLKDNDRIPGINHMTIKRFESILKHCDLNVVFFRLQGFEKYSKFLNVFTSIPYVKELFTSHVLCILEKP